MSYQYPAKIQEQNYHRGQRLLLLMETYNLKNRDFEHIADPFRNDEIASFKYGKRTLTEEKAKRILTHPALSDVRLSWLMGYDDHMTNAEYEQHLSLGHIREKYFNDRTDKLNHFNIILSFYGYEIRDSWNEIDIALPRSSNENSTLLQTRYSLIKDGNVIRRFGIKYLESLQEDLGKVVEIFLNRL